MKIKFYTILLLFSITFQAQKIKNDVPSILNRKNEIRIDFGKFLISSRLQLTYEHFLNKDFSVGMSAMLLNEDENKSDYLFNGTRKYQLEPFVRYSLSKNIKSLFYTELFSSVNGGTVTEIKRLIENNYGYYDKVNQKYTDLELGASIGYKVYITQRIPINFNMGLGINLFNSKSPNVIPRVGLSTGYRF
jgi:hypothetical protein